MNNHSISVSAPGKVHLLGEHAVVYGKPALLTTVNLRVTVTITATTSLANTSKVGFDSFEVRKVIEPIVKKYLKIKTIPSYQLEISSQLPIGAGLGSSAAVSASYIAALLSHLGHKWDLNLINQLTFEAEKVFHGNPSGGDNSTVVFGGLIWFRKETQDLKLIQQLPFSIPPKLAKNFVLINTGKPKQTTKQMVGKVGAKCTLRLRSGREVQSAKFKKLFDSQEQLVKELVIALKEGDENKLIKIIRAGEKNLESIGVSSKFAQNIIRKIEKSGGAAKICGAGATDGPTGILLCYHSNPSVIKDVAKSYNLDYFITSLGVEGLRQE